MMKKCEMCRYLKKYYQFHSQLGFVKAGVGYCLQHKNYLNKRKCDDFVENVEYDKDISKLVSITSLLIIIKKRLDYNVKTITELENKLKELKIQC